MLVKFEVHSFNTQKLPGHVTWPRPFSKNYCGVMSGLFLGTRMSNLKSVALTVLELLAFNAAVHRHTHRHTSNENSISAIHSVHLTEIINQEKKRKTNTMHYTN